MWLVDTDILIHHLRGLPQATEWLLSARRGGALAVSAVTVTELIGGMRAGEKAAVLGLVGALRVLPATEVVARRAGELMRQFRRSHQGIGLADYIVAATASVHGADLATLNIKHYPMLPGLAAPFALDSRRA
jgi:predicted nucleic acid-binding protein